MNMSELRFYTLNDIAMLSQLSRLMYSNIPSAEEMEAFTHFKNVYYQNATFLQHQHYAKRLLAIKSQTGSFPSEREFYLQCRRPCLCEFSSQLNDDEFVNAATFFMKNMGDIYNNQCELFYFHKEFSTIEHRSPVDMQEFNHYIQSVILATQNPEAVFNSVVARPISSSKVDALKQSSAVVSNQSCGICQDDIQSQEAVKLDCGHYFHAKDGECCENGTIFNWLKENRVCPICRHELL